MNLVNLKNVNSLEVETISEKELKDLRIRDNEENIDFEDLKRYLKLNQKLTNV